jgi:hypothetical protein
LRKRSYKLEAANARVKAESEAWVERFLKDETSKAFGPVSKKKHEVLKTSQVEF